MITDALGCYKNRKGCGLLVAWLLMPAEWSSNSHNWNLLEVQVLSWYSGGGISIEQPKPLYAKRLCAAFSTSIAKPAMNLADGLHHVLSLLLGEFQT